MKQNVFKSNLLLKSAYKYAKTTPSKKEELKNNTFDDWLNVKGSVYDSENAMVSLYENTTDKSVKELIDSLNTKKRAFAKVYQESNNTNLKTLQNEINKIEVSLSSKVSSYQDEMKLRAISHNKPFRT
jgi:acylphosphatase